MKEPEVNYDAIRTVKIWKVKHFKEEFLLMKYNLIEIQKQVQNMNKSVDRKIGVSNYRLYILMGVT